MPQAVHMGDASRWGLMVGAETSGGTHGHMLTPGGLIRDKTGGVGEKTSDLV